MSFWNSNISWTFFLKSTEILVQVQLCWQGVHCWLCSSFMEMVQLWWHWHTLHLQERDAKVTIALKALLVQTNPEIETEFSIHTLHHISYHIWAQTWIVKYFSYFYTYEWENYKWNTGTCLFMKTSTGYLYVLLIFVRNIRKGWSYSGTTGSLLFGRMIYSYDWLVDNKAAEQGSGDRSPASEKCQDSIFPSLIYC